MVAMICIATNGDIFCTIQIRSNTFLVQ